MEVISQSDIHVQDIAAIGITEPARDDRRLGQKNRKPICNAIVWQCRRTAPICDALEKRGLKDYIKRPRVWCWTPIFRHEDQMDFGQCPRCARKNRAGELLFGTVDTWLVWKLTDGRVHITDCHERLADDAL